MNYGLLDITRAYLGGIRTTRWYLGSTMIFNQLISFDEDYVEIVANMFSTFYGYANGFGGSIVPGELLGETIISLHANSAGSELTLQLENEIPNLEAVTLYARSSNGTDSTVELLRQPGSSTYLATAPAMLTVFVAAYIDGLPMVVNLTGTTE